MATVDDALAMIRTVGALVGRSARAEALAEEIEQGFAALAAQPPLRVCYLIWRDPWMTVGGDTFIHDVLRRASLANVFGERTRYPEVTAEEIAAAAPDVLLLSASRSRSASGTSPSSRRRCRACPCASWTASCSRGTAAGCGGCRPTSPGLRNTLGAATG